MDKSACIQEAEPQFKDARFYTTLNEEYTKTFADEIKTELNKMLQR